MLEKKRPYRLQLLSMPSAAHCTSAESVLIDVLGLKSLHPSIAARPVQAYSRYRSL